MSKKKKVAPVVRPPTKRQLSRWQKQKRQQNIIFGIGMVIIAAVVILIGSGVYFGWYVPVQKPLGDTVLVVGETKFNMRYYIDSMKYQLEEYIDGTFGGQWYYAYYFTDYILDIVQNSEIMRQEAAKMGITVSEAEIDFQLKGHPDIKNRALRDIVRSSILVQKLNSEFFVPQLSLSYEQRQIMAMLLESQTQLDKVKAEIEAGASFGDLAAEYSLDQYTKNMRGELGFRPREVISYILGSTDVEEAIFSQGVGTLGQFREVELTKQLGYWLVMVTERNDDGSEAHIMGILLSSEEEAYMVKAILDSGEDFMAVAEEYSQFWDEEKQCDLGWRNIEDDIVVGEYAFADDTELMVVSPPIKDVEASTTGAYWLIDVRAADNLPLTGENLDIVISSLFNDWLAEVSESVAESITNNLDQEREDWVVSYFMGTLG